MSKSRLSVKDAADYLGVATSTIYRWVSNDSTRRPNHLRLGGRIYFRVSELNNYLGNVVKEGVENEISLK